MDPDFCLFPAVVLGTVLSFRYPQTDMEVRDEVNDWCPSGSGDQPVVDELLLVLCDLGDQSVVDELLLVLCDLGDQSVVDELLLESR